MPRLSDTTRAQRRQHILTSAWRCFSRDGFHATSMDDIIAATGMSSSAVYRYFRSKDELIQATADEGLAKVRQIFIELLACESCPTPAQTLALLVGELESRVENSEYDLSRIALQTWAEALRNPTLHERARVVQADCDGPVGWHIPSKQERSFALDDQCIPSSAIAQTVVFV